MAASVVDQIGALERERTRLEGHLAADGNWRQLQSLLAMNGSAPDDAASSELRLKKALAANPYYAARLKIVEAITILRRLGEIPAPRSGVTSTEPASSAILPDTETRQPIRVPLLGETAAPVRDVQVFSAASPKREPPPAPPAPAEPRADEPPSELTRVRGITPGLAVRLGALGTTRCAQMAAWTAADVHRIASALGLGRRISKENWIEQAAMFARPLTGGSARGAVGKNAAAPEPAQAAVVAAGAPVSAAETRLPAAASAAALTPSPLIEPDLRGAATPRREVETPKNWLAQRRVGQSALLGRRPVEPRGPAVMPPPIPVLGRAGRDLTTAGAVHTEAEVTIVGRKAAERTVEPAPALAARTAVTLRTRLLGVPKAAAIDAASHAGYRGTVQEASVEIVQSSVTAAAAASTVPGRAGTRRTADAQMVARFFQALTGTQ